MSKFNNLNTEYGIARAFAKSYQQFITFCLPLFCWFYFNGKYHVKVYEHQLRELVANFLDQLQESGNNEEPSKLILRVSTFDKIDKIIEFAKSFSVLSKDTSDFDSNPFLFNLMNGTLNLLTMESLPHNPDDYITKISSVAYDPNAECPNWENFLKEIIHCEKSREYLQKCIGHCLIGENIMQSLFILWGIGANGKSTFIEIIHEVFGHYSKIISSDQFLKDKKNNNIARFYDYKGIRLASISEIAENDKLNEVFIKQLTGNDTISAVNELNEEIEFKPETKVFLISNHLPKIEDIGYATWRRLRIIPFQIVIPEHKQDKNLLSKLKQELPGILNWIIEGYCKYKDTGLDVPESIQGIIDTHKIQCDPLGEFYNTMCHISPENIVQLKELDYVYEQFCEHYKTPKMGKNKLSRELERNDDIDKVVFKTDSFVYFRGISIKHRQMMGVFLHNSGTVYSFYKSLHEKLHTEENTNKKQYLKNDLKKLIHIINDIETKRPDIAKEYKTFKDEIGFNNVNLKDL